MQYSSELQNSNASRPNRAPLTKMYAKSRGLRRKTKKPVSGFGMVSAMILLVIVGLLTTWIGVALIDHARRIKGERIGVEITAVRDLMQTFVDLHGEEVKKAFWDKNKKGSINIPAPLPGGRASLVQATEDTEFLAFDSAQIMQVADALKWRHHVKLGSNGGNYQARVRPNLRLGACTEADKNKCTLQILVYLDEPLRFLNAADTVAVQSALAIIGSNGGASISHRTDANATHFRFSSHAVPMYEHSRFLSNPTEKAGTVAALSGQASTYQPFLHRDGGKMEAELNMNRKDIVNAGTISGIEKITALNGLAVENDGKEMRFGPGFLSSKENFTVSSPTFTFKSTQGDDSSAVSISGGHLQAKNLKVDTLSAKETVQFREPVILNTKCTGSQIAFETNGEPVYCRNTWQPLKRELIKEVEKKCPPPVKPPPDPKRNPQFKEGTMKWVAHSKTVLLPLGEREGSRSVFFFGSEWNHCEVVIDYEGGNQSGRYYHTDELVDLRRSKFKVSDSAPADGLARLGKEPTWHMTTHRKAGTEQYTHKYLVTCYRPAIMGSDNYWHLGSLPPLTGTYITERDTPTYERPQYRRIERTYLVVQNPAQ